MSQVDLHTHSTASDGTFTPFELVRHAKNKGLQAIALTDHDTTGGLADAMQAGIDMDMEVIPGCELSVEYDGLMHILGLWVKPDTLALRRSLKELRDKRNSRNEIMIKKLQNSGIDICFDDVKEIAGDASIGRPHISRVLMNKGVTSSIQEAFDKYIGPTGTAYVPKEKFSPEKAIAMLKEENATVILAHPFSLKIDRESLKKELMRLKNLGLDGVEVYYPEHTREQTKAYEDMCNELGLLLSGGSDFHGSIKPHIKLGKGKGKLNIPYSIVENMKKRRAEQGLWT